eukprot:1760665-Prymnesium_polylepis.1
MTPHCSSPGAEGVGASWHVRWGCGWGAAGPPSASCVAARWPPVSVTPGVSAVSRAVCSRKLTNKLHCPWTVRRTVLQSCSDSHSEGKPGASPLVPDVCMAATVPPRDE